MVVTGEAETITGVATVDTVTTEQIDLENARNISEALDILPGVYTSTGTKNEQNLNIRGFNERYIPVFYDGIPLYIPYDGYVDTGNLPVGNVSQVTLTKGTGSVLYGPNSMGGVINIVSRRPEKPLEASVTAGFVEDSTVYTDVNLGTRQDKFYVTVSGSYTDSEGFVLSDRFDETGNEDGNRRDNSDIEDKNWAAKIGFTPTDGHEYVLGIQGVDREKGLPPTASEGRARYWRFTDWQKDTYYFLGDTRITDRLSAKTRIFRDEYYNVLDSYDDGTYTTQDMRYAFQSTYDDYSNGGSIVLRTEYIPKNTLSFSFHYKEDVHKAQGDRGGDWERYEQQTFSYGIEDDFKILENLAWWWGPASMSTIPSTPTAAMYGIRKPRSIRRWVCAGPWPRIGICIFPWAPKPAFPPCTSFTLSSWGATCRTPTWKRNRPSTGRQGSNDPWPAIPGSASPCFIPMWMT